jgi:hypothetical protein
MVRDADSMRMLRQRHCRRRRSCRVRCARTGGVEGGEEAVSVEREHALTLRHRRFDGRHRVTDLAQGGLRSRFRSLLRVGCGGWQPARTESTRRRCSL